jgi:LacI family transcriptional regulator
MAVTMRDVAATAGVSIRTVSRVVNGQGEISEDTRQRVMSVIQRMGYRPNLLARGLVTQRTRTIGMIIADITNQFFATVVSGCQEIARQQGYNIFLCSNSLDVDEEEHQLRSLVAQGVDGIILFPLYNSRVETLQEIAQNHCPIIVINAVVEHPNIGVVLTEIYQGAAEALDHLIQRGHRQIGMLAGAYLQGSVARGQRIAAYRETLVRHGIPVREELIRLSEGTIEGGYAAARSLLTEQPEVTAIFAYNDMLAVGALRACQDLGRQVPEQCALVGFDDIPWTELVSPTLSSVRIDQRKLGRQAMQNLLHRLNPGADPPPAVTTLGVELIVRESS